MLATTRSITATSLAALAASVLVGMPSAQAAPPPTT